MLCTRNEHSIVGQLILKKNTNKLLEKEIRFVVMRGRHVGEIGLNESSKNVKNHQL